MTRGFYRGLERVLDHVTGTVAAAAIIVSSPVLIEYVNSVGAVQLLVVSYVTMASASICTAIHENWDE